MKYSIRGNILAYNAVEIVNKLNRYELWRLTTERDIINKKEYFNFEVWLNSQEDKDNLFNGLKVFISEVEEFIDWHECRHDEELQYPCIIAEEYRGG